MNLPTYSQEYIDCPGNVLAPLLEITEDLRWGPNVTCSLALFECNSRTLGVSEYVSTSTRFLKLPSMNFTYRIEKFKLIEYPDAIELYDTIYAATLQGKGPAEVMLKMLSESMERK